MNIRECLKQADEIRPNTIPEEVKAAYIFNLESEIAEMMQIEVPENLWPQDQDLLMPFPHDNIYVLYLQAMIDAANQEASLYANDMQMANAAIASAKSWYRRHNPYVSRLNWRVL